jgi:hypothetical protein
LEVAIVIRSNEDYIAARDRAAAEAAQERVRAEKLWQRLQAGGDRKAWQELVDDPELQTWAFCERLCHESAELAEDDPGRAGELAALALELAPKVSGEESVRCGIQEYAWMHAGNVCRARGDLKQAEEAFRKAKEFFVGAMMGMLPSPIRRDRLAGLEAALLRDEGKLTEALKKIDFALHPASEHTAARPALLLEEGRLRRRLGQAEAALQSLARADQAAQGAGPRLLLRIQIELGAALCDLGRPGEVKKLPAKLRKAAEGFPLERARLLCLEGRVAAGLGRLEEAEAALATVRADLPDRAVNELALLALEVVALYARQGRTAELKNLAEQTLRLVEAPGLLREAAATLKLCSRLAAQEKLTAERATQFARDLSRAAAGR